VLNIAVRPGIEVSISAQEGPHPVVLHVEQFGDRYPIVPGVSAVGRHPLLEAAIDAFPPPDGLNVEVTVRSSVPAGGGVGTSAAVAVALVGGLVSMRHERMLPRDVAYAAHRLEVETLGESGIQDQLSAVTGGINYLEVEPYPETTVRTLPAWDQLDRRLTVVFLGRAHNSSDLHRQVIQNLGSRESEPFDRLRAAAIAGRDAVLTQDLTAFGQAMIENTEAQRSLHPGLVGTDAGTVLEMAARRGALGWKVNGAGGDGGSITVLTATERAREAFELCVADSDPRYRILPIRVSSLGLQVRGAL
jgi:D-glycero-alpha-D-manno-heptose-7-phosphate kinase